MKRWDYLLLVAFCLCVFGIALVGGRPLTMHEAVLPQCTREMHLADNWLVPTSGGRPWLHRPPLPHWTLRILNLPYADIAATWQVRLGPLLAGTITVLLSAWLMQRWFGRALGLLTGLILATSFQFTRYAWLAEEDQFLCTVIAGALALFAKMETEPCAADRALSPPNPSQAPSRGLLATLFGWQSWTMLGFFLLLGLSNLAKGLIFGPLMVLVPVALFLLTTGSPARIARYFWFWGILLAALAGGLWPLWIYRHYPDVLEMWRYDYGGRLSGGYIGEPWWYYGSVLLWAMLPWSPCVLLGLLSSARKMPTSPPVRFLWCWSVGILVFFSIPDGKHHHYFIHSLPAWAMLAALGLKRWWDWVGTLTGWWRQPAWVPALVAPPVWFALWYFQAKLPEAAWLVPTLAVAVPLLAYALAWSLNQRQGWRAGAVAFGTLGSAFIATHLFIGHFADESRHDAAFLRSVPKLVPADQPLIVNAELRSCLEVNRILFDLGPSVRAVHNLTFLLADTAPAHAYLLTQAQDESLLEALGDVRRIAQSPRSRREAHAGERLTLFEIKLDPGLPRYSASVYIEQQQIKQRKEGPYLGGRSPREWGDSLTRTAPSSTPNIRPAEYRTESPTTKEP